MNNIDGPVISAEQVVQQYVPLTDDIRAVKTAV